MPSRRGCGPSWAGVFVAVGLALAGCVDSHDDFPDRWVRGIVTDMDGTPLAGAQVTVLHANATTDADGAYDLFLGHTVPLVPVAWQATADGHAASEGNVTLRSGTAWLNITLYPTAPEDPVDPVDPVRSTLRTYWNATITCDAVLVVGHDHGSGAPDPSEHTDCDPEEPYPEWPQTVPDGAEGLVVEVQWQPDTPLATHLTAILYDSDDTVLAWSEGPNPLRLQVPRAAIGTLAGQSVRLLVSAGAEDSDAAAGVAYGQDFEAVATWSVVAAAPGSA